MIEEPDVGRDGVGWDELMATGYPEAVRLVARHLPRRLRGGANAEDIVMDAVASLLPTGEPPSRWLLFAAVRRRMIDGFRRQCAAKRGGRRVLVAEGADDGDRRPIEATDPRPGPEAVAVGAETMDIVRGLATEEERPILALMASGLSAGLAALELGLTPRSAQRRMRALRERFDRHINSDAGGNEHPKGLCEK